MNQLLKIGMGDYVCNVTLHGKSLVLEQNLALCREAGLNVNFRFSNPQKGAPFCDFASFKPS